MSTNCIQCEKDSRATGSMYCSLCVCKHDKDVLTKALRAIGNTPNFDTELRGVVAEALFTVYGQKALGTSAENKFPRVAFRSSCTGVWYGNLFAAGSVDGVKVDGELFVPADRVLDISEPQVNSNE